MTKAKRNNLQDVKPQYRYLHPDLIQEVFNPSFEFTCFELLKKLKFDKELPLQKIISYLAQDGQSEDILNQCAYGMMAGAIKYDPWNFLKGFTTTDILDSLERHFIQWLLDPLSIDSDASGILKNGYEGKPGFGEKAPEIYHYGLVACNVNMAMWLTTNQNLTEDRGFILFGKGENSES